MKGENFSLYKNIKHLCRGIYQSIKYNDSVKINFIIDTFSQLNYELENRINLQRLQKGGYSNEIEQLKNSIIQRITSMKQTGGVDGYALSDGIISLKGEIINSIKNFSTKNFTSELKKIEESLNGIKRFIETYKSLQRELTDKNNIITTKYNDKDKQSLDAFRALMATISPTELSTLELQLKEFTTNIRTIVDDSASPPDDLEQTIKQTCRSYIPQPAQNNSIQIQSQTPDLQFIRGSTQATTPAPNQNQIDSDI
jgi:hypothetical protein